MIRNVKVEIGEFIVLVDFHTLEIKSGWKSSLLFGCAFMATIGAISNLKKNKMCLTIVDKTVFYDPLEKTKSEKFISCIELPGDPAPIADSKYETEQPASASIDPPPASIDTPPASIDTLLILKQI